LKKRRARAHARTQQLRSAKQKKNLRKYDSFGCSEKKSAPIEEGKKKRGSYWLEMSQDQYTNKKETWGLGPKLGMNEAGKKKRRKEEKETTLTLNTGGKGKRGARRVALPSRADVKEEGKGKFGEAGVKNEWGIVPRLFTFAKPLNPIQ